jgi:hypothetical protein
VKEHPERKPDEVFLGYFSDNDCHDGTGRTQWECVGWKTKRRGINVYDTDGKLEEFSELSNYTPVFVKQDEIRKAEDGEKILASLLP